MESRDIILNFSEGKKIKNYTITSKPSSEEFVPLGAGGSGVVYLAKQMLVDNVSIYRAIKFFVFSEKIQERVHTKISANNFVNEIVNITQFTHENILKVIDGGIYNTNEINIPYIVTEYIDGNNLEDILSMDDKNYAEIISTDDDVFKFIIQILNGISYLHKREFYHCDIAPKNIFVGNYDDYSQIIIGDLGAGITLDKTQKNKRNDQIKVIGTKDYMPEIAVKHLDEEISYEKFFELQPAWDIHSTKKTLITFINNAIRRSECLGFSEFSLTTLKKCIEGKKYKTIDEMKADIERIKPINRITAEVIELSEADSGTRKKLLPISSIIISKRINRIISHSAFARLQNIPQLLMGSTIFPGANHTRLEHSLGTYENMRKMLIEMLKKENFIILFDKKAIELALVSALLSSTTRFPFSFIIHELKQTNNEPKIYANLSRINLLEKVLNSKQDSEESTLMEIIQEEFHDISYDDLSTVICERKERYPTNVHQFLHSILHSTIDARVLDFLVRDSHHLGLENSINFSDLIRFVDEHNNRIAIRASGVNSVEQVVAQRYWLYKSIYWNEPNRLFTVMLKHVFWELYSEEFESKLLNDFMTATPNTILNICANQAKETGRVEIENLINTQLKSSKHHYERIYVINASEADTTLSNACEKIAKMTFGELCHLREELQEQILTEFDSKYISDPAKIIILVDIPSDDEKKIGDDINVIQHEGGIAKLVDVSGIVSGINLNFNGQLQWLRIFIHKDFSVQHRSKKAELKQLIDKYLIDRFG